MHETHNRPLAPRFLSRLIAGLNHREGSDTDQQPAAVVTLAPVPDRAPETPAEHQPAA